LRFFTSENNEKQNAIQTYIAHLEFATCGIKPKNAEKSFNQIIDLVRSRFHQLSETMGRLKTGKKIVERQISMLNDIIVEGQITLNTFAEVVKSKRQQENVLQSIEEKITKCEKVFKNLSSEDQDRESNRFYN
jgi:predicted RNase H-like nuclease (RuvC/YqgF family)